MEAELRHALDHDEMQVYYQPIVAIRSGKLVAAEALVRWQHPVRGLLTPAAFLPLAEATGLINPLAEWVLRTTCVQLRAWRDANLPLPCVSFNPAACQFQPGKLADLLTQVLRALELDPTWLAIEIAETIMIDPEITAATLAELAQVGVHLWVDDFGMGYSSLRYLKRFPFTTLKLDPLFVSEMVAHPADAALVTAILGLARQLELAVVAEGVQTAAQRALLDSHGCDFAQGYLFSPPLDVSAMTKLLQDVAQEHTPLGETG